MKNVTEKAKLEPLTDYSRFKMQCEEILMSNSDNNFIGCALRPATVCRYSPRQRLDLVVNILTNFAFHKKDKSFWRQTTRPNIHISDMVDSYLLLVKSDERKIRNQIFNVGFENYSVEKLAEMVKKNMDDDVTLKYKFLMTTDLIT